jgi:hypothetical protein
LPKNVLTPHNYTHILLYFTQRNPFPNTLQIWTLSSTRLRTLPTLLKDKVSRASSVVETATTKAVNKAAKEDTEVTLEATTTPAETKAEVVE